MADSEKGPSESETILMALDQISQTIDVMTSVVGRLRNHMIQKEESAAAERNKSSAKEKAQDVPQSEVNPDRILH